MIDESHRFTKDSSTEIGLSTLTESLEVSFSCGFAPFPVLILRFCRFTALDPLPHPAQHSFSPLHHLHLSPVNTFEYPTIFRREWLER